MVLITVPVAALLPNPSAVLLMAPLMPPMARELKLDFRPLLILMVLAAISASLLTLVGDPALYIIGTGIHWDFARYLRDLGPAALLVLGVVIGGNCTTTLAPPPGQLLASMLPPWASLISRQR